MATTDWRSVGTTGVSVQEPAVGAGAQVVLLALLSASVGLGPAGWLAGTAYALATCVLLTSALNRSRAQSLGPADRVTLARSTLAGGVTALVVDSLAGGGTPVALLVMLAAVALVLDGVDGHVARRTGTVSTLGARFDMEVDAFLILVLSVFVAGFLGAWVLVIGAMRYAFAAAAHVAPWLRASLPPSFARKTVAALQGVVLVIASAGILPYAAAFLLVGGALATLVWSFGRDIGWLWRTRYRHAIAV
ncbi:CDP-alcohol phosphatidyltransferase family protein [Allosalinactinospora lopnorensis]|uniref:CDP-alcohol phosphatidyltransferase family protein n=1 Tax=Allosalinactinospora lopnorensis TaxID=1352348 RepID=UPI000623D359|nr:CDP-alcohol phosphatidyltransferase family protein [Allosalinactinospora lopnorensis]